jgi:selenocysteine lyase/cysteine desulfurase
MCASAYKWLLCPYGLAFLYAKPGHCQGGVPLEHHNWERSGGDFYKYEFNPGARRYDSGQRSNFITLPAAIESLKQLQEWGPVNISACTRTRTLGSPSLWLVAAF